MKITVQLNGTAENPYHRLGLTGNPFPQLAIREYDGPMSRVQALGADPIPDAAYIRAKLVGFSDEFIELCCAQFRPGEMQTFDVEWPTAGDR